jgi:hypothetical protein
MRYAREPIARIREEVAPLLLRHYQELGQQDMEFDPDWERALALEAAGVLVVHTCRTDEGVLVGYTAFLVQPHLHYRRRITAVNDVIWLAPEVRGGTGLRFLRAVETGLIALGVAKISWHAKPDHPALGRVLTAMGYRLAEHIYTRRVI